MGNQKGKERGTQYNNGQRRNESRAKKECKPKRYEGNVWKQ